MPERSWHLALNSGSLKCKNKSTSSGAVITQRKSHTELDFSESRVSESIDTTNAQGLKSLVSSQRSNQLRMAVGSSRSPCNERNTMSVRFACCKTSSASSASSNMPDLHKLIRKQIFISSWFSKLLSAALARNAVAESSCITRTSGPKNSLSNSILPDDLVSSRIGFRSMTEHDCFFVNPMVRR